MTGRDIAAEILALPVATRELDEGGAVVSGDYTRPVATGVAVSGWISVTWGPPKITVREATDDEITDELGQALRALLGEQ